MRPSKVGNPSLLRAALRIKDMQAKYDMLELLLGAGASLADVVAEGGRTIECGLQGSVQWDGIAAVGNKLFCAPFNAPSVLVIDVETEAMRTIETGVEGGCKCAGIAAVGTKLFCAPRNASSVLILDGDCSSRTDELSASLRKLANVEKVWTGRKELSPGPRLAASFGSR